MVNFLNLKVVLFCEQEYMGVNMLPEVPKIEMAKEKKRVPKIERQLTFRVPSDGGATALNPGFGPGPRSAGYHHQGPGPIFVLQRACAVVRQGREKARLRPPRINGTRRRFMASELGGAGVRLAACLRSSASPLPSRASAQITIHGMRMR